MEKHFFVVSIEDCATNVMSLLSPLSLVLKGEGLGVRVLDC